MKKIIGYTDGGCIGNPGRGAWAFVIVDALSERILEAESGYDPATTNNRMELQAVIELFTLARRGYSGCAISLFTDSQYVKNGITVWIHNWMRNNWKSANKKPVKNVSLWQSLYEVQQGIAVEWHWVKGHADNHYNEQCHSMVQKKLQKN